MAKDDGGSVLEIKLRDSFALNAMRGLLQASIADGNNDSGYLSMLFSSGSNLTWNLREFPEHIARLAYEQADAMLVERSKPKDKT